jgi:hypothetical protein
LLLTVIGRPHITRHASGLYRRIGGCLVQPSNGQRAPKGHANQSDQSARPSAQKKICQFVCLRCRPIRAM